MADRKRTRLLIDGDHIVFAASAAVQTTVDWGDDISSVFADRDAATEAVERYVERHMEDFGADEVLFAVSNSKDVFRHKLFPDYKGNRPADRRPIILGWLRQWTVENLDAKAIDNIEADDVVGISATHPKWRDWRQVIITEDKDLKQIPGEHFRPSVEELLKITPEEAELHFWCQALAGDVVDNFPGCPGVGMIRAKQFLSENIGVVPKDYTLQRGPRKGQTEVRWFKEEMDSTWEAIVSHYEKAGLTEEDAILQARIAYILRYEDYDFKKGEVKLWQP